MHTLPLGRQTGYLIKLAYSRPKIKGKRVLETTFWSLGPPRAPFPSAMRDIIVANSIPVPTSRAPETPKGNERVPPHPHGIPVLAAPLSGIPGRREAPSDRSPPGGAGPRPAR